MINKEQINYRNKHTHIQEAFSVGWASRYKSDSGTHTRVQAHAYVHTRASTHAHMDAHVHTPLPFSATLLVGLAAATHTLSNINSIKHTQTYTHTSNRTRTLALLCCLVSGLGQLVEDLCRPKVGSHNDDSVLKRNRVALRIRGAAVVQDLQQHLQKILDDNCHI